MAALTCEICGGKLVGKPGGIFECDSCGMEYSTEWAKAKIQEIKGTVKVEGTVEVQGTVKLDGPIQIKQDAKRDRYLQKGWELLKYREWKPAKKEFETALEADPESAEAYLGVFCSFTRRENMEMIAQIASVSSLERDEFQWAKRYATGELKQKLQAYETAVQENETRAREASEKKKADEAAFEAAEEVRLAPLRARIQPARGLIAAGADHVLAVKTDGTVLSAGRNSFVREPSYRMTPGCGQVEDVRKWSDIIAVAAGEEHSVGLKSDGTVVAAGRNEELQCEVQTWRGITAIAAGQYCTVGLQRDGHVIYTGHYKHRSGYELSYEEPEGNRMLDAEYWHDIVQVSAAGSNIYGIRSDGTCVAMECSGNCCRTHNCNTEKDVVEYYGVYNLRACGKSSYQSQNLIGIDYNRFFYRSNFLGIKSDGTCWRSSELIPGMETWTDLVALTGGEHFCVGLKKDGTLVAAREEDSKDHGQCNVSGWKLFDNLENIAQERIIMRQKKREKDARIKAMEDEWQTLVSEKMHLGFFSRKREKEIDARIAELNAKLREERRS